MEDTQRNRVSKLFVRAGDTKSVKLRVEASVEAGPEYIPFAFAVAAGNASDSLKPGPNVLGRYELDHVTEDFYVERFVGDALIFVVDVKNTCYNDLSNRR